MDTITYLSPLDDDDDDALAKLAFDALSKTDRTWSNSHIQRVWRCGRRFRERSSGLQLRAGKFCAGRICLSNAFWQVQLPLEQL